MFLIRRDPAREAEIEALARYVDGRATDEDTVRLSESLRGTVDAHVTTDGVLFGTSAWLITADRP